MCRGREDRKRKDQIGTEFRQKFPLYGVDQMHFSRTVSDHDIDHDDQDRFYINCGFKELEVFPLLWDEANPCQIYVMSLK